MTKIVHLRQIISYTTQTTAQLQSTLSQISPNGNQIIQITNQEKVNISTKKVEKVKKTEANRKDYLKKKSEERVDIHFDQFQ